MRRLLPFLLLCACSKSEGRPEDVAKAAFEALKAGEIGPLEPHLITPAAAKAVTGVEIDTAQRERWQALLARDHERLDVDWESASPGRFRVQLDALGRSAVVRFEVTSGSGGASVEVTTTKAGRRFVFAGLKATGPSRDDRQAAPDGEGR